MRSDVSVCVAETSEKLNQFKDLWSIFYLEMSLALGGSVVILV